MHKQGVKSSFYAQRPKNASDKDQSPPQKLEVSLRSGLYFLVLIIALFNVAFLAPKTLQPPSQQPSKEWSAV